MPQTVSRASYLGALVYGEVSTAPHDARVSMNHAARAGSIEGPAVAKAKSRCGCWICCATVWGRQAIAWALGTQTPAKPPNFL